MVLFRGIERVSLTSCSDDRNGLAGLNIQFKLYEGTEILLIEITKFDGNAHCSGREQGSRINRIMWLKMTLG